MNLECSQLKTESSLFYKFEHPQYHRVEENFVPQKQLTVMELKSSKSDELKEALNSKLLLSLKDKHDRDVKSLKFKIKKQGEALDLSK